MFFSKQNERKTKIKQKLPVLPNIAVCIHESVFFFKKNVWEAGDRETNR